jgi:uncharacterized protein YkwD
MSQRRLRIGLVLLALSGGGCVTTPTPDAPSESVEAAAAVAPSDVIASIVELTNSDRAGAGVGPVLPSDRLMQAAQLTADQLVRAGRLDHVLPEATYPRPEDRLAAVGYQWRAYGENLASGQRTAGDAMIAWMQSPDHRENVLNPIFAEIGAAYAVAADGRRYYVQLFGRAAGS